MPTDDVVNEIIYVTILMNFLIHELNKFTSIESPSQSLNGHCNCILDEADNRGKGKWATSRGGQCTSSGLVGLQAGFQEDCSQSPTAKQTETSHKAAKLLPRVLDAYFEDC